jgi:hypothetical protein
MGLASWEKRYETAQELWRARHLDPRAHNTLDDKEPVSNTLLIMAASQHPLKDGLTPGDEFASRLDEAAATYKRWTENGRKAEIFVPGSRHLDERTGQIDKVSLSDAGVKYLLNEGVGLQDLHGEDWIADYSEGQGIYSGADEIFVAAEAYKDNPSYRDLVLIVSPGQVRRAEIYSLANGVVTEIVVPDQLPPEAEQFHSSKFQDFILRGIAKTIDPDGQSFLKKKSKVRIPNDGNMHTLPELQPTCSPLSFGRSEIAYL